jgi:hypothetical protein
MLFIPPSAALSTLVPLPEGRGFPPPHSPALCPWLSPRSLWRSLPPHVLPFGTSPSLDSAAQLRPADLRCGGGGGGGGGESFS